MKTARQFHSTQRLRVLANSLTTTTRDHEGADVGPDTIAKLRPALQESLDLLNEIALGIGLDRDESRAPLATRDTVASHLRAADDVLEAGVRPQIAAGMLVEATLILITAVRRLDD